MICCTLSPSSLSAPRKRGPGPCTRAPRPPKPRVRSIPTCSAASSGRKPSPMTITSRLAVKAARAKRASYVRKARNIWCRTAMCCTSSSTCEGPMQYFEDLEIGAVSRFGSYDVTREEVIEFASKYDPQPFHLDDEAAAKTHFGRLSASGWHTCAMTMAMMVENLKTHRQAGLGSPGMDSLRWKKPVYPGDTLRVETELLEKRRSSSRPEMGLFKSRVQVFNQNDEVVLEMISNGMIEVRNPDAPIGG